MAPKSERFEMRLDEDILGRVDQWRSEQDDMPSRAEAMRRLIESGLEKQGSRTVKFSDGEKMLFMVLRDICNQLNLKKGETDLDFVARALYGGHYWAPKWTMSGLYHEHEDSESDVRFVVDVLDMWSFIEAAYTKFTKKEKEQVATEVGLLGRSVQFNGFDGNNEPEMMGIAMFLVDDMNRFSQFKGRDMNSHRPMASAYRKMYAAFKPMRASLVGIRLSVPQIAKILQARTIN